MAGCTSADGLTYWWPPPGLGVVIVCGVLVANRLVAGPDVALFHRINHWPGWLYPPMWVVQLSGVIGAPFRCWLPQPRC